MKDRIRPGITLSLLLLLSLFLIMISGCRDQCEIAGKYKAEEEQSPGTYYIIELHADGLGTWETELDIVHFRWKTRGNEIWLNTASGRTIQGIVTPEGLSMILPGLENLDFTKQNR